MIDWGLTKVELQTHIYFVHQQINTHFCNVHAGYMKAENWAHQQKASFHIHPEGDSPSDQSFNANIFNFPFR